MPVTTAATAAVTKPPPPAKPTMKPVKQAGVSLQSGGDNNPNPIQHGGMGQAERAFSAASTFLSGIMAISASQFIGAPLKFIDPNFYEAYMAWTKESFAVLMTTITQWWAPTVVKVSGDDSMKGQLFVMDDGTLKCNFPHRIILMGNHQLYTDWLYLWWIAYTNKMHGRIYIILKESLKQLPIIGWGMQFYNFIFLSRKWEQDRYKFKRHLDHLKNPKDPMWLLIFPEGTNLSAVTREKSAKWAQKTGVPDMKHQLLPRSTGLQFCLQELRPTTNWLYDCTIAYEGVPRGQYGQDIFTLKSSLFEGRPPKSVNMYWRRFKTSEIPYEDDEQFSRWLLNRWREKDYILEYYYKFGTFPAEGPTQALLAAEGKRQPSHAKSISTSVKGGGWDEFLSIFGPITTAAGALSSVDMTEPFNLDEMMRKAAQSQQYNLLQLGKMPMAATAQDAIRNALLAANKQNPLPNSVINKLLKTAPATQAQMKQALQTSGDAQIAKEVARAPGSDKALPSDTQKDLTKAAGQTQKVVSQAQKDAAAKTPAQNVRREMPLVNMESMITRPISTMAIHSAGQQVQKLVAAQAQKKSSALPVQKAASTAKTVAPKTAAKQPAKGPGMIKPALTAKNLNRVAQQVDANAAAAKANSNPAASRAAGAPPTVRSAPVVGNVKKPGGKIPPPPAAKKAPVSKNSKPLGTRKYVNGKPV
ncbi:related to 1-acyl-sn-glycerol-3-phosphate acyltransferase gamma [Lecanosticta acicola]|uniref:Related to 1-acyl-sn-glycerol-3-phosphate acyltransferase gamma n=1 Tax=Lecanosticta acicola TaxID=111012 RepID=A0AAI8Z3E7_9PEZI|nr:related to 1-acyl-sn-glycerol-3-phosphate acyltransferase gamma [Lecanosticta acicola]